jgi:hypothetical protein
VQEIRNDKSIKSSGVGQVGYLDKLEEGLSKKLEQATAEGHVGDIQVIKKALGQVEAAKKDLVLSQKITNSQARLGQIRTAQSPSIETQSKPVSNQTLGEKEATMIQAIRSVPNATIGQGQRFNRMYGPNSNTEYMKTNINGLFALMDLKK